MQLKSRLAMLFPRLARLYLKVSVELLRRRFKKQTVSDTFSEIYRTQLWGSATDQAFFSGHGSRDEFTEQYAALVSAFIREHGIGRVLDIGCGDFRVGSKIVASNDALVYVGLDIVPDLINHHSREYGSAKVEFLCRNAIDDELPSADLCLIRQVLQHLSNTQVAAILAKCERYPYVIVTEDVYVGPDAVPNVDKPHGPDTRWFEKSGIFVDKPPFSYSATPLLEISLSRNSLLRTVLIKGREVSALATAEH